MSEFIVGRHPVIEALRAGSPIEKIFIQRGTQGAPIDTIYDEARKRNVPYSVVPHDVMTKLAGRQNTQGVVAVLGVKQYCEISDILSDASVKNQKPFILIFDEIEDPHNLGALIRTAVCSGAHGGIIPKHHAAAVTDTVAKTSAGASVHFPVAKVTNIVSAIEELQKEGIWIVGTESTAEKKFTEIDYDMPVGVVVGNEGKGLRRLVKEKCDFLVSIPMAGEFESLNASVAGALVMYEVMRKRSKM